MSTKIFYAYRIKNENLEKFLIYIHKLGNLIKNDSLNKIAFEIASKKINYRDKNFLISHLTDRNNISYTLDRSLTISILTSKDGYTYIKLFGHQGTLNYLEKKFEKIKYIEDYHYQNQTEPPEDIPQKEFNKRGKKWDKITGGISYNTMLSIILVPDFILETFNYSFLSKIEEYTKNQ